MMLSRPSKTCWKAFSDTVTIVHSARSPYVWFCDDMTVTFHCSFFTKTTFEWFWARKTWSKHPCIKRNSVMVFLDAFISATSIALPTSPFFLRLRNPERNASLVEKVLTQTSAFPVCWRIHPNRPSVCSPVPR